MRAVDAVEVYFTEVRAPRRESEHTERGYRSDLRSILAVIARQEKTDPAELTVEQIAPLPVIRRAFGYWVTHGPNGNRRAHASIHRAHSTWSGFFDWLVADGIVPGNPMAGVKKPPKPDRLPKPFTTKAADRIVDAVQNGSVERRDPWPELEQAVILTDLATGIRTSELLGLDVDHVGQVPGNEGLRVVGKGGHERLVPVNPILITVLGAYLDSRRARFPQTARQRVAEDATPFDWWKPGTPLFVGRKGDRLTRNQLAYMVRLVFRAAGVEAERIKGALTHALRHTVATRTAEQNVDVFRMQALFGWKTLTTPQHYVKVTGLQIRDAAELNPLYARLDQSTKSLYASDSEPDERPATTQEST